MPEVATIPAPKAESAKEPVAEKNLLSQKKTAEEAHINIQPKLTVGAPDDPFEKEADAIADQVMRMPEQNFVHRKYSGAGEQIQRDENEDKEVPDKNKLKLQPTEPDFLSLRAPFFERNAMHLWDPNSALGVWRYNFDFFKRFGLDDNWSGKAANLTAPFFINSQLKVGNPTWWEVTDAQLNTTSIVGSLPLFSFDSDFRNWKPLPFLQKKSMDVSHPPTENFIQQKTAHPKEEEINTKAITPFIQTKTESQTPTVSDSLTRSIQSTRGGGSFMDHATQTFMSSRFGVGFDDVKIHTDDEAIKMNRDLNAKAFTVANDIYFNKGQYEPGSSSGKQLLAHELTHVVQQNSSIQNKLIQPKLAPTQNTNGSANNINVISGQNNYLQQNEQKKSDINGIKIQPKLFVGPPDDPREKQADAVANKVMRISQENLAQSKKAEFGVQEKLQTITPLGHSYIQRDVTMGEPVITSFLGAKVNASENIKRLKEIIENIERILIITGNQLVVYNAADGRVVGNYTINNVVLPAFYYIGVPDGGFVIAALSETSDDKSGTPVSKMQYTFYGKNNQPATDEEKQLIATMDEQLTVSKWFTNNTDREKYFKDIDGKVMAVAVTPLDQLAGSGSAGEGPSEVPPILPWMPAWEAEMKKLIKETRDKDPVSTDIPEVFKFYYSKTRVRWRALANMKFEEKKIEVYLDINEKDDKAQKLSLIRDKLRIKQLTPEESVPRSKDAKELEEELTWAYRIKKELDKLIAEERAKFPTSADLPDSTAIITLEDQPGKAFLKLSVYVIQAIPENTPIPETKATSVLKTGVLPQPLPHPPPDQVSATVSQLFDVVKKATLSIRGQAFKPNTSDPSKAEKILEPFPASIGVIAGREDFKTVTSASLDVHMNLNMSSVEGINTLHLTSIAYKGIYYTWDIYRVNDILTNDEKKSLDSDWAKRRGQLMGILKDSGRMKAVNPVINEEKLKELNQLKARYNLPITDISQPLKPEELRELRNQDISYGSATKLTADTTLTLPPKEDDYVIYCRAVVEPDDNVFRLPSEAFYPIKVLDGYTLAEETRDANLEEINDLNKQIAATDDEKKKEELTNRVSEIKKREKLSLKERTAADLNEVARTKRLANRLIALYKLNLGKKVSLAQEIVKEPAADVNDLFQLWFTIETTNPGTPQIEKLQKMIGQLDEQVKGLTALQNNISDFSGDMAGYNDAMYTPVTALVSKVTGEVYNLITMLAVKNTADGGTEVILVDVTAHQTQEKYYGSSKANGAVGLEEAVRNAYNNFGEECKYGDGYIAYRVPGANISGRALSKPGFKQRVLEVLGYIAMAAGIAALVLGTIATGGALGVAAFALGIGAGVIGAGLAIHNIYDRAVNHRLEADVELAMDILNIIGPILQGLSALSKIAKLGQAAKLGKMVAAGTAVEESAETIATVAKLHRLVQIQKAFAILQKGEAITNLSLIGYKTFKDLAAIQKAYENDPKKRSAMEWEVLKNAALAGTIALVAVRNEFKPTSAHMNQMEELVNSGYKEKNYVQMMIKSGLFNAEGKWIDPTLRSVDESSTLTQEPVEGKPADKPTDVKPVEPDVKPTEPEVKPTEPEVKPTEPEVKPTEPEVRPDDKEPAPVKPVDETPGTPAKTGTPDADVKPEDLPSDTPAPKPGKPAVKKPRKQKEKFPVLVIDKPVSLADGSTATLKADGSIIIQSRIGKGKGRKGYEKRMLSGIKVGLKGWHRAHSQGQGTGSESPYGIFYAPPEVNLAYQNSGIEGRIREIFRITPPEFELTLTTVTKPHPSADGTPSRRLASIEYRIEISEPGQPRKFIVLEAGLKVEDTVNNPKVEMSAESFAADALWSIRYGEGTTLGMTADKFAALKKQATQLEKQLNELIDRLESKLKTSKGDQRKIDQFHLDRFKELRDSLYEHPDMIPTIRAEMEEAAMWYPKEPLISADAQSYLSQWRGKINQGSKDHIKRLLELSGSWKDLIKKLQADPTTNKTTLKILETFRNNVVKRLKKTFNGDTLPGASTNPESDVDLNLKGPDAGANLIKAEGQMKEEFGDNWSKLLRLNFYTEGERLLRYAGEKMSPEALKAFEKELTRKSIQFSLAKMLQHAKATPEGAERVNGLIKLLNPQDAAAVKTYADMDAGVMLQKRNQLHAEVDALQKELNQLAPGDPARIEKSKQVTMKQMEINFYSTEAYIGPGTLMQTAAIANSPALKVQKVMGNLEMMEHIIHESNGNIIRAMKEYELYKYMYRISDTIGARQTDLFFDYLTEQLYKVNRQGAESMTAPQLQDLYNNFMTMVNKYLNTEIKNVL